MAAFTGMISGERVIERPQIERSAAVSAVEALAEAVAPAPQIAFRPVRISALPAAPSLAPVQAGAIRAVLLVNGSRLE